MDEILLVMHAAMQLTQRRCFVAFLRRRTRESVPRQRIPITLAGLAGLIPSRVASARRMDLRQSVQLRRVEIDEIVRSNR